MDFFKDIPGFEGRYQAGKDGTILSLIRSPGSQFLNQYKHYKGHMFVFLYKEGVGRKYFVHRLVAMAHLPNFDAEECVNHRNGSKTDNRVENLEWTSVRDNTIHYYKGVETMEERNASF